MLALLSYCFLLYLLGGIGSSIGYHRILTHKSAELPKLLEYIIVVIGLPAGTPIQWVGNHRTHHQLADKKGDPHSPQIDGFWYAHCGWYIGTKNSFLCCLYALAGPIRMLIDSVLRPRTNQEHVHLAKDIQQDNFYRLISKPVVYMLAIWCYLLMLLLIAYGLFEWKGIVATYIMLVIIYNLGDAVDSFGHIYGNKKGNSHARNNVILGILSFGDGWHANHHLKPRNARHGSGKNQFDLSYLLLKIGKYLGIVKKLH